MPDNRIYDAINVFKYSRTGQGTASIGGDATYRQRYRQLAQDVVTKLWELYSADEIAFAPLGPNLIGDSLPGRPGADIRVNNQLEPSANAATYATAAEQGKLAACSGNIVHEATHIVRPIASYPESEVLCRTIQLFYIQELKLGCSYQSCITHTRCTAKLLPLTPWYQSYQWRLNRLASSDLIDSIFDIPEYRRDLETAATADFVARSQTWWGGLDNRWPSTKGLFLKSLASQTAQDYSETILKVLESITAAQWSAVKSMAGNLDKIRQGLRLNAMNHRLDNRYGGRIVNVQRNLGENFGIH
jgi:hypothetical protein